MKKFRILSIDGGGYMGLASAALIEEAERHFNVSFHDRFDMFCGTSTGSLIALALASGRLAREVAQYYQAFGKKVFKTRLLGSRLLKNWSMFLWAKHSNSSLKSGLDDLFGAKTLGDVSRLNKFALVPSFCISNGRPRIFKTDHAPDLTTDNAYLLRDIALASAAAPVYLPIVRLRSPTTGLEESFCDGGVYANHPALLGYTEALHHMKVPSTDIQILSIGSPRKDIAEYETIKSRILRRGALGWGEGLFSIFTDATTAISHQVIDRIAPSTGAHYKRIEMIQPPGVGLDVVSDSVTSTLRQLGAGMGSQKKTRDDLSIFLKD